LKLSELKPDTKNANRGTKRGRETVAKSLQQFGAGRSVLIDKNGNILAGNTTVKQAVAAGIQDVIVVQTDGTQLVAVQRTDLSIDDPKARGLAVADNRTAELGLDWDADILGSADFDLLPYFTAEELGKLKVLPVNDSDAPDQSNALESTYSVLAACSDEASQLALLQRLTGEGYECRSLIA
jgi:hypothetical protein